MPDRSKSYKNAGTDVVADAGALMQIRKEVRLDDRNQI